MKSQVAISCTPTQISLGPVILRNQPVAQSFASAEELGYDAVELHLRKARDVDEEEICRLMEQHHLAVTAIGTGMAAVMDGLTFAHPDAHVRRKTVGLVFEHIRRASLWRSAVIIGSLNGRIGSDPNERTRNKANVIDCYRRCCDCAGKTGVTLLLEPLNRYESDYLNRVEDGMELIKAIGMPNVRLLADTFHMNIEEQDMGASLRRADSMIGYVHLADSNRRVPGQGHTNLAAVARALQDCGYEGGIGLECLPVPDARTAAQEGLKATRALFSQ